ncbi:MAG: NAD(P)-dependent oxidoreductase [Blastocatellia bacterium]|nr:NAD(P)-dependent oxidoreductase [Blastocatellia bacterium]MCS7156824.1 NAD(P)-dependent oxidoreductase [Blastocatellia bacterium]MDW8167515.1 NAD(P)-dependent oxidoreductase [Acidobacteriota bacterium]MDW8256862.1 NAD(P)-dependent oxidoreductase [Acidobacteriota bacterium]
MRDIGFIGLGIMGRPMAERLLDAGYTVMVFNRTRQKAEPLLARGAHWADSPEAVARRSEMLITIVSDSDALEDVARGPQGVLRGIRPMAIHVDMSTVAPRTVEGLERVYQERGATFLHAPVLGNWRHASEGNLLIFVGGDRHAYERCEPVLRTLGRKIWYFERITQATHMKLIANSFIASMILTLAQAFVFGRRVGITPTRILEILDASALNAPMYQSKGRTMRERDFRPNFYTRHMLKDIDLALDAARCANVPLPVLSVIRELFVATTARGFGDEDYSAVLKVLEEMAGLTPDEIAS